MTFETVLERFGARRSGSGYSAKCPSHDDRTASLSINRGDNGGTVIFCQAGCSTPDVLAAVGLTKADLMPARANAVTQQIVATYDYTDEHGALLYQVVRSYPKKFQQRRPDGAGGWIWKLDHVRRVLFGLPELQQQPVAYIVEGEKDVLALRAIGLVATTNASGAGQWRPDFTAQLTAARVRSVVILPDSDAPGRAHAETVARSCHAATLRVTVLAFRDLPTKGDVSDWIAAGHSRDELIALAEAAPPYEPSHATPAPATHETHTATTTDTPAAPVPSATLAEVHQAFRKWLGAEYDLDAITVTLAAAAVERLDGDPLWLLLVSGSGNAKTETVQALSGSGAFITSTIASDGALLSGSSRKDKAADATGGLLRRIGARGVLVLKDLTSILSMNRDARGSVLAALREIHDGRWERNVGSDGGRTLTWTGRLAIIGACTTAWDTAHSVIASMGDRFIILRLDSSIGRLPAGRHAVANTGSESQMRAELAATVAGVLASVRPADAVTLTTAESERLLVAADLVTRARTGVEYDYRGNVIDSHAPEMPTRFAKELSQVLRGAVAVGLARPAALRLALRCARDSMPPLRLAIVDDVAAHPGSLTKDVRQRLAKPWATIDRQLQALHILGVLHCDEEEATYRGKPVTNWRYRLADGIDAEVLNLNSSPEMLVDVYTLFTPSDDSLIKKATPINISGLDNGAETAFPGVFVSVADDIHERAPVESEPCSPTTPAARGSDPVPPWVLCPGCGDAFVPVRRGQRVCRPSCRRAPEGDTLETTADLFRGGTA